MDTIIKRAAVAAEKFRSVTDRRYRAIARYHRLRPPLQLASCSTGSFEPSSSRRRLFAGLILPIVSPVLRALRLGSSIRLSGRPQSLCSILRLGRNFDRPLSAPVVIRTNTVAGRASEAIRRPKAFDALPHCPLCDTSTPGEIAACTCVDCPNRQREAA